MSENEYVATAAAEKRLREILADRLPGATERNVDDLARLLLDGAKIEYKSRAKQVAILLDLPETATTRKTKSKADDGDADQLMQDAGFQAPPEQETIQGPPIPHIVSFTPQLDPDAEYEDVHYD